MAALSWYLDTSFLVALLTAEPFSERADDFLRQHPAPLTVSDFAAAEFASALARRVRMRESSREDAVQDFSDFDLWAARSITQVELAKTDIVRAASFLRRLDLPLRTPDAIHIAIVERIDAALVTFDQAMAASARVLGTTVMTP